MDKREKAIQKLLSGGKNSRPIPGFQGSKVHLLLFEINRGRKITIDYSIYKYLYLFIIRRSKKLGTQIN